MVKPFRPAGHAFSIMYMWTDRSELKQEYPEFEDDDIRQALEFAADNLDDQIIAPGVA